VKEGEVDGIESSVKGELDDGTNEEDVGGKEKKEEGCLSRMPLNTAKCRPRP